MSRDTAVAELLSINIRLKSEISRLRDGCTSIDLSGLRTDLQNGRQCIEALQQDHNVSPEITVYQRSLQELLYLLPHLRIRLLIEKVRVEGLSRKLSNINQWARSASAAK